MTSAGDTDTLPAAAADNLQHFCTLRKNNLNGNANDDDHGGGARSSRWASQDGSNVSSDADTIGQFCTVRGTKVTMGNVNGAATGYDGNSDEVNRNLLYEENMCTFENFCEKSLEQAAREDGEGGVASSESIENFCTLRKKRPQKVVAGGSGSSEVHETSLVNGQGSTEAGVGSYCTLKKKKLKLNQKFVESFLEDPNAKLHDYLSELDAYLDEMDGLDSLDGDDEDGDAAPKEESSVDSDPEEPNPKSVFKKSEHQNGPNSISYIDVKNFCTLPKKKRVQFLDAFNRGGPLRRTFAAPNGSAGSNVGASLFRREGAIAEVAEDESSPNDDRDSAAAREGAVAGGM